MNPFRKQLPVMEAAMNLVMAIARLAAMAAKIVLCEDPVAISLTRYGLMKIG